MSTFEAEQHEIAIQRIVDEDAIRRCIQQYCRGVDRRDWDLVRSAFHADAVDNHGAFNGSVDGLIAWLRKRHESVEQSMHFTAAPMVDFVSAAEAVVETYTVTFQRVRDGATEALLAAGISGNADSTQTVVRSRYVDRFARRDAEWRILERTVVYESVVFENSLASSWAGTELVMSRRDGEDPLYTLLGAF